MIIITGGLTGVSCWHDFKNLGSKSMMLYNAILGTGLKVMEFSNCSFEMSVEVSNTRRLFTVLRCTLLGYERQG